MHTNKTFVRTENRTPKPSKGKWGLRKIIKRKKDAEKSNTQRSITDEIGEASEAYFFEMFTYPENRPFWFCEARKANDYQDIVRQTDAYVFLSNGKRIPIQIKSSMRRKLIFDEEHADDKKRIVCVVIRLSSTLEANLAHVLTEIGREAERLCPELFEGK